MCIVFFVVGLVWNVLFGGVQTAETASAAAVPAAEGCISSPGRPCSYVATQPGRYLASGTGWFVEVIRPSGQVVRYHDGESPNYIDAINADDRVTATAGTGLVRVGARPPQVGR